MLLLSIIDSSRDNRSDKAKRACYTTIVAPRLNSRLIARRSDIIVALRIERMQDLWTLALSSGVID